jgi:CrcB protein
MNFSPYFVVGVGSALGGMGRFWLSGWVAQRFGESFPLGTLIVNVTGSLLIGFLDGVGTSEGRVLLPPATRQFLMVGIMGGYTTFSSFSLQTMKLLQDGQWFYAAMNVVASVLLCLAGTWIGILAGRSLAN